MTVNLKIENVKILLFSILHFFARLRHFGRLTTIQFSGAAERVASEPLKFRNEEQGYDQ